MARALHHITSPETSSNAANQSMQVLLTFHHGGTNKGVLAQPTTHSRANGAAPRPRRRGPAEPCIHTPAVQIPGRQAKVLVASTHERGTVMYNPHTS